MNTAQHTALAEYRDAVDHLDYLLDVAQHRIAAPRGIDAAQERVDRAASEYQRLARAEVNA